MFHRHRFAVVFSFLALALSFRASAQVLAPNAFLSSGVLFLPDSTAYTIDTDALTFAGKTGVLSNGIAVFDFDSVMIGANVTINVVGNRPLALLSRADFTLGAGSINLNGGTGGPGSHNPNSSQIPPGGVAGAAGPGGYAGGKGHGGDDIGNSEQGGGPAGGTTDFGYGGGGGGGFGGGGGYGGDINNYYGPTYGDLLVKLEGGSGGGGGSYDYGGLMAISGGGGGGGGGALEISFAGTLTLLGSLNANGGDSSYSGSGGSYGGSGAGGGILLAGQSVSIASSGQINANGNNGGLYSYPYPPGGGGGGRITILTTSPNNFRNDGSINVEGGYGTYPGAAGVITINGRAAVDISGTLGFEGVASYSIYYFGPQNVTFVLRSLDGNDNYTIIQSTDGPFKLTTIPANTYHLWIKADHYLSKAITVDSTKGPVSNINLTLLAGDVNNDNRVDLADFGILVNAYGSNIGDPSSGYDARVDLDYNGTVDGTDFGILVNNYGSVGDP